MFVDQIQSWDYQDAYDSTSTQFQKYTSLDVFKDFMATSALADNDVDRHGVAVSVDNWLKTKDFTGEVTDKKGDRWDVIYTMLKEDGEYLLMGLEVTPVQGAGLIWTGD